MTGAMRRSGGGGQDVRRATDLESLADLPDELEMHRLSPVVDHWPGFLARYCGFRLGRWTRGLGLDERAWSAGLRWRFQRAHDRLSFPDRGIWRLASAVGLALKLHRHHRFDAIFSSGMPFSDHVVGLVLQSLLRRPWLADFRDPWVEYIHWRQWETAWGGRLTRATEAAVVRRASFVIGVNEHMTRRFAVRYGRERPGKFVTIPNGFDPLDFEAAGREKPCSRFRLLYAGSLYGARSPKTVLEGFRRFLDAVPGSRSHARFDFAGRPGPYITELKSFSEGGAVQYLGMLPHAAALRSMASADVNVVILPKVHGGENDTTAKIYECLGSNRAMLAAVPSDGAAAAAVRRFNGVWLCDPEDPDGIAEALKEMYGRWLAGTLRVIRRPASLWPFTREHQTGQLASLLDAAIGKGLKAESRKSKVESRKPKVESRKPKVESRKSKAENRKSKVESRNLKAGGRNLKVGS